MHDNMPTDERLMERGCNLSSICNLCLNHAETTFHLFFDCPYAVRIWNWLSATLSINLHVFGCFGKVVTRNKDE